MTNSVLQLSMETCPSLVGLYLLLQLNISLEHLVNELKPPVVKFTEMPYETD